jgi:hypothetical protein
MPRVSAPWKRPWNEERRYRGRNTFRLHSCDSASVSRTRTISGPISTRLYARPGEPLGIPFADWRGSKGTGSAAREGQRRVRNTSMKWPGNRQRKLKTWGAASTLATARWPRWCCSLRQEIPRGSGRQVGVAVGACLLGPHHKDVALALDGQGPAADLGGARPGSNRLGRGPDASRGRVSALEATHSICDRVDPDRRGVASLVDRDHGIVSRPNVLRQAPPTQSGQPIRPDFTAILSVPHGHAALGSKVHLRRGRGILIGSDIQPRRRTPATGGTEEPRPYGRAAALPPQQSRGPAIRSGGRPSPAGFSRFPWQPANATVASHARSAVRTCLVMICDRSTNDATSGRPAVPNA